ncbi:hypothetical protein BD410DRAFT_845782 [Rickenella mellea]|uniref:JmjC domain-containing protein n=1 Tax=Rickenella mellea TaxID=50990 RepID=A0A4Y7PHZ3_9AGAM|nr:hypothetical protein BD410DRAFT_845782 [Rickenella mellea]
MDESESELSSCPPTDDENEKIRVNAKVASIPHSSEISVDLDTEDSPFVYDPEDDDSDSERSSTSSEDWAQTQFPPTIKCMPCLFPPSSIVPNNAVYYTLPSKLCEFLTMPDSFKSESPLHLGTARFLSGIFQHVKILRIDLQGEYFDLVSNGPGPLTRRITQKPGTVEFRKKFPALHHLVLRTFACDRFLWMLHSLYSGSASLTQTQEHLNLQPTVDKRSAGFHALNRDWLSTVTKYCVAFRAHQNARSTDTGTVQPPHETILGNLFNTGCKAAGDGLVYISKAKFCHFAMGLNALSNYLPSYPPISNGNPLVSVLRQMGNIDEASLVGWQDSGLLRVVYHVIAFKAIVLLDLKAIHPTQRDTLSLPMLIEALMYPSALNDPVRLRVELDLLHLGVRMAREGADIFEDAMAVIISGWEAEGYIFTNEDGAANHPLILVPCETIEQWDAAVPPEGREELNTIGNPIPNLSNNSPSIEISAVGDNHDLDAVKEQCEANPSSGKPPSPDSSKVTHTGDPKPTVAGADDGVGIPVDGPMTRSRMAILTGQPTPVPTPEPESAKRYRETRGGTGTRKRRKLTTESAIKGEGDGMVLLQEVTEELKTRRLDKLFKLPKVESISPQLTVRHKYIMSPMYCPKVEKGKLSIPQNDVTLDIIPGLEDDIGLVEKVFKHVAWTREGNPVHTTTNTAWTEETNDDQRLLYKSQCIHIVADGSQISAFPGVTTFNEQHLLNFLELRKPRHVQDLLVQSIHNVEKVADNGETILLEEDLLERQRRMSVLEFLHKRESDEEEVVVNFLDLAVNQISLPGFRAIADGLQLADMIDENYSFTTPWPSAALTWALMASKRAVSRTHMDPSGFGTYIQMILGRKIWFVPYGRVPTDENGWITDETTWRAVFLCPGDVFLMRPGTPHFVVTVEDALAVGGHFYNRQTFSETLRALVLEHKYGANLTNTEHLTSPIILIKLLHEYCSVMVMAHEMWNREDGTAKSFADILTIDEVTRAKLSRSIPEIWRLPKRSEFYCLLLAVKNIEVLVPETTDDINYVWQDTKQFSDDFSFIKKAIERVGIPNDENWDDSIVWLAMIMADIDMDGYLDGHGAMFLD